MQANVYSIDGTPLTSERFDQIQDLFVRALEQGETGRAAFLQQACAGDEQLRREVESLLAEEPRAGNFMEGTLDAVARELISAHQRLTPGVRIGHYEITSFLDAGGMGEEDRALDVGEDRERTGDVLHAAIVRGGDRLWLQLEKTLEDVTILDGLENGNLLGDEHLREARIEMTGGAAAHDGERTGASAAVVRDLDDVPDLLQPCGQDHRLALHPPRHAASVPALAQLVERSQHARPHADHIREAD